MKFERVSASPMPKKIAELDKVCFPVADEDFEMMVGRADDFGDIYTFSDNGALIGYAVYGQVWLPQDSDAYISRIGVYPHYRQQGWGLKILDSILADLNSRRDCHQVHADIRQSNIASQRLFRRAGFHTYCERDEPYGDEIGIRVIKALQNGDRAG